MTATEILTESLNGLGGFIEPITSSETTTCVKVICRIAKGYDEAWAAIVERLLRLAEDLEFKAHICRLYFLHEGNMVYGWHILFESDVIKQVIELIAGEFATPVRTTPSEVIPTSYNYSPPLEADSKGNPIVNMQVEEMTFTGMEGRLDRNAPSPPDGDGRGGGRGVTTVA